MKACHFLTILAFTIILGFGSTYAAAPNWTANTQNSYVVIQTIRVNKTNTSKPMVAVFCTDNTGVGYTYIIGFPLLDNYASAFLAVLLSAKATGRTINVYPTQTTPNSDGVVPISFIDVNQ